MKAKTILGAMKCPYCGEVIMQVRKNGKTKCPYCWRSFIAKKIIDIVD